MMIDARTLGKALGILKIAQAIDPNLAALKKSVNPPKMPQLGKEIQNAAMGDLKTLNRGVQADLQSVKKNATPRIFARGKLHLDRIGVPKKLANYDPDVEYWEDFNDQYGDGLGNASHNEETQPPPADTNRPEEQDQVYGVNSASVPGVDQAWGEHERRTKAAPGGVVIPATNRLFHGA